MIGRSTDWKIRVSHFGTSCLPKRCVQMKSNACVKVDVVVWIVVTLALPLEMGLVDFKNDLVVMESIVIQRELECRGQ